MLTRRGLFGVLTGFVAAPIVARSGILMPVHRLRPYTLWGDGIHDEAEALHALLSGDHDSVRIMPGAGRVISPRHIALGMGKTYRTTECIGVRVNLDGNNALIIADHIDDGLQVHGDAHSPILVCDFQIKRAPGFELAAREQGIFRHGFTGDGFNFIDSIPVTLSNGIGRPAWDNS